jgi:hypothetical protein
MPGKMDMFDAEPAVEPDRDVGGVEFKRDELGMLVSMFESPAYQIMYTRLLNQLQRQDVEDSLGTRRQTDTESLYRSKGAYLAIEDLKLIPDIARQVLADMTIDEKSS